MNSTQVAYDPIRELTYIRAAVPMDTRTIARCQTCGRTEDCICDGCETCTGPKRKPIARPDATWETPKDIIEEEGMKRLLEELGL